MLRFQIFHIVILVALVTAGSCSDDETPPSSDAAILGLSDDGSASGTGGIGGQNGRGFETGGTSGEPSAPTGGERGDGDAGGRLDAGATDADGSAVGADSGETDSGVPVGNLTDYLPCETDSDCPVSYGDCVTTLPLNVADQGTEQVSVQESFPDLDSEGICTRVCTNSSSECDGLNLEDQRGDPIPYTCQLIYVGTSPYPDPMPSFPFDDEVDADDMTAGVPFAAICRPPFGLAEDVLDEICDDCTDTDECGDGICWDLDADEEADGGAGSCLAPCGSDDDCPGGFECDALSGDDEFCVPIAGTCGTCSDPDDDGFGVGQCADDDEATPVDCDEDNPLAYYDPDDMNHPFPENCGGFDYNCNGLSDEEEQSGADVFGAEHCGGCDQPCAGELFTDEVHTADALCVDTDDGAQCVPDCVEGYADCNGELDDGCEIEIVNPNSVYYRDADGDGDGDPNDAAFACNEQIPEGYVAGDTDCDDSDPEINGTLTEVCDGKDNDCSGSTDDDWPVGDPCDGEDSDQCPNGTFTCTTDGLDVECVNESVEDIQEACDGKDTDCDGSTDAGFPVGDPCDGVDLDDCENGTYTCRADGTGVECINEAIEDVQEVCDGEDNDCDGSTDENWAVGDPCDGEDSDDCENGTYTCRGDELDVECVNETVEDIEEVCDNIDNDCDGDIDEGFDGDTDGYYQCEHPGKGIDCDDNDATVNPAVAEVDYCDHKDNDCDGDTDEDFDLDHDGYLDEDTCPVWGTDCCDFSADVHPGQTLYFADQSPCGGWDYNCDDGETKHPDLDILFTTGSWSCVSFGPCTLLSPGYWPSIPACGVTGQWIYDCYTCDVWANPVEASLSTIPVTMLCN